MNDGRQVTDNSIEEKGKVEVNGKSFDVSVAEAENKLIIDVPEEVVSMGDDAVEQFRSRATEYLNAKGKTLKERMEWNKEREDREKLRSEMTSEIEKMRKELDGLRSQNAKPKSVEVPSLQDMIAGKLGVEKLSKSELRDFIDENPDEYTNLIENRQERVAAKIAAAQELQVLSSVKTQGVRQRITNEGYDIKAIEAFKNQNGFTDIEHAFRFYKAQNKPSTSPIDILNSAEKAKGKTIEWRTPTAPVQQNTALEQYFALTPKEQNQLSVDDPRFKAAMEYVRNNS